jgi:high-affinity iron transporter
MSSPDLRLWITAPLALLGLGLALLGQPPAQAAGTAAAADPVKGQAVYMANCMACHGAAADGNGPAAAALKPRPTNFSSAAWWEGKDDARVRSAIKSGKPGTAMMPFSQLSNDDLTHLVAFLRTKIKP